MKNIDDQKLFIYERDNWQCQVCGNPNQSVLTIAHRIRQGKGTEKYLRKYLQTNFSKNTIDEIVNNPLNMCLACAGACNSKVDITFNPVKVEKLLNEILKT